MCGIVGYIGSKQAYPILIQGLRRLEYRGYDSAGVALLNGALTVYKCKGKVQDLARLVGRGRSAGTSGIGHTRWATHGAPNKANAHPHLSESGQLAIVHNGIIENYFALKKELQQRGHRFRSETDTEVLVHLIEDIRQNTPVDLEEAVRLALNAVVGAYAVAVLSSDDPDKLIAARKGSPLVVGIGAGEYYLASDAAPIIGHARKVVYLRDEEIAVLPRRGRLRVRTLKNVERVPYIQALELELGAIEKGRYEHFMLKEIFEQPRSIRDCLRGRLHASKALVTLGGIRNYSRKLVKARRVIFVACGTSWHAALVGKQLFEDLAGIPAEAEYASEFRYRDPLIFPEDIVISISQSGETADSLAAVALAKAKGATVLGICNVVGSSIARATHAGCYTHAGPEIGVASTKAFTAQLTVLALMALDIAQQKGAVPAARWKRLLREFAAVPGKVEEALGQSNAIRRLAVKYKDARNALYLGRGYCFPVALEGALKLKEISYIHAEGLPAAEMKHGPIALIDENVPVMVIATRGRTYEKILSNIQEVKARKGRVIAVVTRGDKLAAGLAEDSIDVPQTEEIFTPLVAVIPLQLFAYHVAALRGYNVDQPRNLAKSVTVE